MSHHCFIEPNELPYWISRAQHSNLSLFVSYAANAPLATLHYYVPNTHSSLFAECDRTPHKVTVGTYPIDFLDEQIFPSPEFRDSIFYHIQER